MHSGSSAETKAPRRTPSRDGRQSSDAHLHLVQRPDSRLLRRLDAIESGFGTHHEQLLTALDAVERDLEPVSENAHAAHDQIAFLRVGLRCLADALADLHTCLSELATGDTAAEQPPPDAGGVA